MHYSAQKDDSSNVKLLPIKTLAESGYQPASETNVQGTSGPWEHGKLMMKGWPQNPRSLQRRWHREAILLLDMIIALIPLLFIALSISAIHISGSAMSLGGNKVKAATLLGPTLFPIMFAAIVGRSLKALASYLSERGAKLGQLEQLMGSVTIFGAIEFLLGVGLIVLWAFSPLGGQASLRLLHAGVQHTTTNQSIRFLDSDSFSFLGDGIDTFSSYSALIGTFYLSSLFSTPSSQASNMDTWGNLKIPLIEAFEQEDKSDADGWFTVGPQNKNFSSLVGMPVVGMSQVGTSNFSVESNYMGLYCTTSSSSKNESVHFTEGNFGLSITAERTPSDLPLFPGNNSYPHVEPATVNFNTSSIDDDSGFLAVCSLNRSSVESSVQCKGTDCRVARIRRSRFDLRPAGYTPLSSSFLTQNVLETAWTTLGVGHSEYSTPTVLFLHDPAMSDLANEALSGAVSLLGMDAQLFSQRFSLLFNTYYQCSLSPGYQTGNFPANGNLSASGDLTGNPGGFYNTTEITITHDTDVYICNNAWATILFVASALLVILGVCSAIFKYRLRSPQVLGYVSSMTRDNPYVDLPPGGCYLDGLERSRLLKDMIVQLRDVTPHQEVGHIALSNLGFSGRGRLDLKRLYAGADHIAAASED